MWQNYYYKIIEAYLIIAHLECDICTCLFELSSWIYRTNDISSLRRIDFIRIQHRYRILIALTASNMIIRINLLSKTKLRLSLNFHSEMSFQYINFLKYYFPFVCFTITKNIINVNSVQNFQRTTQISWQATNCPRNTSWDRFCEIWLYFFLNSEKNATMYDFQNYFRRFISLGGFLVLKR